MDLINFIFKVLLWTCRIILGACLVFMLSIPFMVACSNSKHKNSDSEYHSLRFHNRNSDKQRIEREKTEKRWKEEQDKKMQELIRKNPIPTPSILDLHNQVKAKAPTPDDAESEGFDEGYYRGKLDKLSGNSYRDNYDDGTNYYDYYEEKYQDGYEDGYDQGYNE